MKKEITLIEQLSHSTVRIETDYPDGKRGTGTGFFYRFAINGDQHVPAIVTGLRQGLEWEEGISHRHCLLSGFQRVTGFGI